MSNVNQTVTTGGGIGCGTILLIATIVAVFLKYFGYLEAVSWMMIFAPIIGYSVCIIGIVAIILIGVFVIALFDK